MSSPYVKWLQEQGVPLFKAGGVYWRLYQGALVPASVSPCFVELSRVDARFLLRESGAWFIRYSSDPGEEPSEWWYIVCDRYDPKKISSKTRYNINRSKRMCSVRQINVEWLAENGYECYLSAYERYKNSSPANKETFRNSILETIAGPFIYWGVYIENKLVGYSQCIVENGYVYTSVSKYNPKYLRYRSAYALIYHLIDHYVVERGMSVISGSRSIAHNTNYQDFLIKLGYRKQFCNLNIIYQPWLKFVIQVLYPFKRVINNLPDRGSLHKIRSLLLQEELRKKCNDFTF